MYPEMGPIGGYAVTCVYGIPDPNYDWLSFMDVIHAMDASPKPTSFVFEQRFPPEMATEVRAAFGGHSYIVVTTTTRTKARSVAGTY
jgi:hypothetical protein